MFFEFGSEIQDQVLLRGTHAGPTAIPLFVHYGQRASQREAIAARLQCDALALTLTELDIGSVGDAFAKTSRVRPHVPLPHRNLVLLSLALSYGSLVNADSVALSIIRDDADWYATGSQAFIDSLLQVTGLLRAPAIVTPLIEHDKRSVVSQGIRLGLDFSTTYSCMVGDQAHCGRCHQCTARRAALLDAGVAEPSGFYRS